jgi:hypothetical protein
MPRIATCPSTPVAAATTLKAAAERSAVRPQGRRGVAAWITARGSSDSATQEHAAARRAVVLQVVAGGGDLGDRRKVDRVAFLRAVGAFATARKQRSRRGSRSIAQG